jgi:sulfate adenylyltransferase subunit 2
VGFNIDCLLWIEKNFPNDLSIIYKTFPMAERVLWEYHKKEAGDN